MKKIIALTLSLLMIFSVFSFEISAASTSKMPKVTAVAMSKSSKHRPVTKKLVNKVIKDEKEFDGLKEVKKTGKCYIDGWFNVDVTFDNGKTITVRNCECCVMIDSKYVLKLDCYVNYDEYVKAKKNNKTKINVYFECAVCKADDFIKDTDKLNSKTKTFKIQRKLINGPYVTSVKPITEIPNLKYAYQENVQLKGVNFEVKYYNGVVKTLTAKKEKLNDSVFDNNRFCETLGGEALWHSVGKKNVSFYFLDCTDKYSVSLKKFPYKSIRILDYDYDDENKVLSFVRFTLEYNNGKTQLFEYSGENLAAQCEEIITKEGYSIYLDLFEDEGEGVIIYVSVMDLYDEVMHEFPKNTEERNTLALIIFRLIRAEVRFFKGLFKKATNA